MIFPALFFYLFSGRVHRRRGHGGCIEESRTFGAVSHSRLRKRRRAVHTLLGAEFLAMILIIVYVGAVLVLFLFVVMMLDVDFAELRQGFLQYLPIGACSAAFC
jgi:NADH-quinone oxidoreductase subunit J